MDIRIIKRYEKDRLFGVYFEDNETGQTFTCEVRYELGGMNYFSYGTEPRGLYLGITPMKMGNGLVSFTAFSGIKKHLFAMNRFNKAKLLEWANTILADFPSDPRVIRLFEDVCRKNNLHPVENLV